MEVTEQALTNPASRASSRVRIRTIALPAEHGGWGLVFEPIVLGLLLAPSVAGLYIALSAVGLFLARHPLTLVILNRTRQSPRTALARRFALLYLGIAVASASAAFIFTEHVFILPLLIATPLAVVQLAHDWSGRRRVLIAELSGAAAVSSIAAAIALSGGWSSPASFALWAIVILRAVPAILYVRLMLARLHDKSSTSSPVLAAHLAAVTCVALLASYGLVSRLAVVAMMVLLIRAAIPIWRLRRVNAKQLGFSEIAFGALVVFVIVLGQTFGI